MQWSIKALTDKTWRDNPCRVMYSAPSRAPLICLRPRLLITTKQIQSPGPIEAAAKNHTTQDTGILADYGQPAEPQGTLVKAYRKYLVMCGGGLDLKKKKRKPNPMLVEQHYMTGVRVASQTQAETLDRLKKIPKQQEKSSLGILTWDLGRALSAGESYTHRRAGWKPGSRDTENCCSVWPYLRNHKRQTRISPPHFFSL